MGRGRKAPALFFFSMDVITLRPLPHRSSSIVIRATTLFYNAMNDCAEVDELLLDLADYKNDYADMAAKKLLRKCSTSWEAFRYLQDRVHDVWMPDSARQRVRQIIKQIHVQINQQREYGWTCEPP